MFVLVRPCSGTHCVLWPPYSPLNMPHCSLPLLPTTSQTFLSRLTCVFFSRTCERGEWTLFSDSHRASPANWPVPAQRRTRSHVEDISAMIQSPTPVCDKEKQFAPINTETILAPVPVAWREFPLFCSYEASGMARCTFLWVFSKHAPCPRVRWSTGELSSVSPTAFPDTPRCPDQE